MCGATQSIPADDVKSNSRDEQLTLRRPSISINDMDETESELVISGSSSGNATGSGRTRVVLKPGHSLMDWIKLTAKSNDLSGTGGHIRVITLEELAKHNTLDDCWICVRGNVYNVSPYLEFHPGGVDEMMRGAGSDATDLFDEIHRYVNFESMLKKCFVGPLNGSS